MNDMSTPAGIGHNGGPLIDPETLEAHNETVRKLAEGVKKWAKLGEIKDEATAQKLVDFISGARGAHKKIEASRESAKKPYLEAGREVDATFKKLKSAMDKVVEAVLPMQSTYLAKKRDEQEAKAAEEAEEAAAAERHAAMLAAEAESQGDVLKMAEAEEAKAEAEEKAATAQKTAAAPVNIGSATGGGRTMSERTTRSAKITNINVLFMHYREHPEVVAVLQKLANADVRARDVDHTKIPGIEEIKTRSAA